MLNPRKDGFTYFYTKGLSMWPALIPHDILRTEKITACELEPGDITVLPEENGKRIIHRFIEKYQISEESIVLTTAGDRSGTDEPLQMNTNGELFRVIGVLRKGRWSTPLRKASPLAYRFPVCIIRFHCRLVRKLYW